MRIGDRQRNAQQAFRGSVNALGPVPFPDASKIKMMNPRRVHELMTVNFPPVELATLGWVNVLEADGTIRHEVLGALIDQFIRADDILVEVNRKLGDLKKRDQVIPYVQEHVGKGQIRIADRDFHGYVLIGMNGVAAGWSSA